MSNITAQGVVLGATSPTGRSLTSATQSIALGDGNEVRTINSFAQDGQQAALGGTCYGFATTIGVAASQVFPTTAACTSLYNGNGAGTGVCFLVKWAGAIVYTGSATLTTANFSLLVRNDVPGQNTAVTTSTIVTQTDGRNYSGLAVVKQNVTLAAISSSNNTGWIPAGASSVSLASASLGSWYGITVNAALNGQFVVRPLGMFSIAVTGGVASSNLSFIGGFIWDEIKLAV